MISLIAAPSDKKVGNIIEEISESFIVLIFRGNTNLLNRFIKSDDNFKSNTLVIVYL